MIKMETNQKITYGMIGLLSLIVATMGGTGNALCIYPTNFSVYRNTTCPQ